MNSNNAMDQDSLDNNYKEIETALGYQFKDRSWLERALTHSSCNEKSSTHANYERLEFLGDAILGLSIAHLLLDNYKEIREGHLSKMRAALVNTKSLAELSAKLDLTKHIKLSRSQLACGGQDRPGLLADVMEAIFGAIYRDSGFEAAFEVIKNLYGPALLDISVSDPKTDLQEAIHENLKIPEAPVYLLEGMQGPEHQPVFTSAVEICGLLCGRGSGSTKKESQQAAAAEALAKLNAEHWKSLKEKY